MSENCLPILTMKVYINGISEYREVDYVNVETSLPLAYPKLKEGESVWYDVLGRCHITQKR